MASGYIGKISAVVTANTSDLSKKLRGSIQDWNKFGSSLNSSLNRFSADATKSIEKIFTPIQQLERKLKAAVSSPLNVRTGDQANQIRRIASAAEQINAPLQAAAGGFQKLSTEVQAGFVPALERAQSQAEALFKIIQVGRAPAEAYFGVVEARVERTTQALQRLTQAQQIASRGFSGNELQFTNPNAFAALNRNAELTRQAGGLPADALAGGDIGNRVARLNSLSQSISAALARLESVRLAPEVDTTQIEKAERDLNSLLATARTAQEGLQSTIDIQANIGASTPFMSTRDPQGRSIQQRITANLLREQLSQENEIVAAQQELGRKIGNGFLTILTPAEAAADTLQAKQQELSRKIGNGFLTILTPAEAAADTLQAKQQELGRKIGNGFLTILTQAEAAADTVAGRVANGRRRGANDLRDSFGGRTETGINFGFEQQSLRGYTAQLQVLQQAIGSVAAESRGPAVSAFSRLRDAIADAMDRGELETKDTRDQIRLLTQDAVAASAKVAGISARGLGRSVARAGDVGRRGFDNISLALNQAAFAVDDFFSATGGLEFKIRAVQNNLTQLGFILGGTAGLFASLGVAIAGQATIALINFLNEGRKTEDMVKALNDSLIRQKEIAGEVGTAFEEIGNELRSDVFSDAASDADRLTERLKQLTDAFKKLREERIAQTNVAAQEAQANINSLERRLQAEEDPGVRVLLQRQLQDARERVAEVTNALSAPVSVAGGIARFREAITPLEENRGSGTQQRLTREEIGRNIDSVISNADIRDFASLRAAVEARFEETASLVNTGEGIFRAFRGANSDVAAQEIGNLQSLLTSIQGFQQAGEALSNAASVSDGIRKSLADARDRIDEFGDGIDSARRFSDAIDAQGRILEEAVSSISGAFGRLEGLEISPEQFLEELNAAAATVDAEAAVRAQLIDEIKATFNEEQKLRRDNAKKAAEEAERERQQTRERAKEEFEASFERGRQLLIGERGRRAEQIAASIGDIRNAGGGQRAVAGFLAEQARQIAPAVFAAGEQILNAVASGPNRAALSASDITTQQGTSELNRLLRGDDPAREQNIVELRKQTAELVGLREDLKNLGVAN